MAAYASRQVDRVPPSARDAAFDLDGRLRRRSRAGAPATGERPHDGRTQGRLRQQGAVAGAEARDARLGAHVRRHGAVRRRRTSRRCRSAQMCSPKIEPEIVFKLKTAARSRCRSIRPRCSTRRMAGARVRDHRLRVSRLEVSSRPTSWRRSGCTRRSSSASRGTWRRSDSGARRAAAAFKVRLLKNGQLVGEGSGKNSLRSPALCLGELGSAIARQPGQSRSRPASSSAPAR